MGDEEIIDGVIEELGDNLPAVRSSGMLLAGTDARAKLENAKEIAVALSDVIEQQKLFAIISGKKHVLVEGWELLGSLLGVFPVVEWTRPTENGWEARVVAKTLDGAEVGSAEMMCTRDENRWKSADDYAIRSMAQTRAVSKSLRAPLGFVMKLAGYEPTPEAEIPSAAPVPPKEFDPETDLMGGAIQGQGAPKRIGESLRGVDPTVDWGALFDSIDGAWRKLAGDEAKDFWRRASNAAFTLSEAFPVGSFPPPGAEKVEEVFARMFSGQVVTVSYVEAEPPGDAPLSKEQTDKIDEALAKGDDPSFGYENPNE